MNQNGEGPVLLPAKRYPVWSRLYKRFLLEPGPAVGSNAYVSPVVQPITDADRLLRTPTIDTVTVSITGAGLVSFFTVPKGDRWEITFARAARASGTMTHNAFQLTDSAGVGIVIDEYSSAAESHLKEFLQPVILDEGWSFLVNFDAHSVTGNVRLDLMYELEDAF